MERKYVHIYKFIPDMIFILYIHLFSLLVWPSVHGGNIHRVKRLTFDFANNSPQQPSASPCSNIGNPCIIPQYCNPGEECTLNSTSCIYTCESCDTGNGCSPTTPTPTWTQCDFAVWCNNGGTCSVVDGVIACQCPDNYTGEHCQLEKDQSTSTPQATNGSTSISMCDGGFPCFNGICVPGENTVTCACYKGFTGDHCETLCSLDCGGENGGCRKIGTREICSCHYNWIGDDCLTPRPKVSYAWVWWTVGGCMAAVILCILLLTILTYLLWKRRVILAMKIVHFFQPKEEADGMLFDAFVSYKSHPDDEEFVLKQIFQKLEKEMNFKLCLHFRDFQIGETIADNILWAVQNSRRTMLIISPNYLDSEFARFEYQTAQVETLKYRQRIIPVLYKSIKEHTNKIDRTLKHILDTITYIEWAPKSDEKENNKFWKRMVLSLPKRTSESKDSSTSQSTPVIKESDSSSKSSQFSNIQLLSYKPKENNNISWINIPLAE